MDWTTSTAGPPTMSPDEQRDDFNEALADVLHRRQPRTAASPLERLANAAKAEADTDEKNFTAHPEEDDR